ncbi:MAG: hypothetical protein AVDCRST_MAG73-3260 [uncultured Thermomicrobiales bacterium]|uniref:Uncharacterized protein n=1 Tax=uncultured Thermomicrobiales bacterium TaxID=1645740 RepID=A0A6J4URF7_9BACT|nr:MAG: hypothetical protein AVDCRST_MAG73-3260 [uncultured Thermomicrobiales bacterium]
MPSAATRSRSGGDYTQIRSRGKPPAAASTRARPPASGRRRLFEWRRATRPVRGGKGSAPCGRSRRPRPAAPPTTAARRSTASSGCCGPAARGAASPRATVPGRRSPAASPAGRRPGSGTGSWPPCGGRRTRTGGSPGPGTWWTAP